MKIAYARSNFTIELDYLNSSVSSLGTELRIGIMDALVRLGHDVDIASPLKVGHEEILSGKSLRQKHGFDDFDYSSFSKVGIYDDQKKYDLMIVEAGSTNTTFKENGISFYEEFYKTIEKFEGNVIIYQHGDLDVSVAFGAAFNKTESKSPLNPCNIYKCIEGFSVDKKYKIWTHAKNEEMFLSRFDAKRNQYKKIGAPIEYTPVGYSNTFDKFTAHEPSDKFDFIYIGSQRNCPNRKRKLLKFLGNSGLKVGVIGKWDNIGLHDGINFLGQVGKHGDVYSLYKMANATLQIGDKIFEQSGMMTTRPIAALASGVALFVDSDLYGCEDYSSPFFRVSTQEELLDKYRIFKNMSIEEKNSIINENRKLLKSWDEILPQVISGEFKEIDVENMEGERADFVQPKMQITQKLF